MQMAQTRTKQRQSEVRSVDGCWLIPVKALLSAHPATLGFVSCSGVSVHFGKLWLHAIGGGDRGGFGRSRLRDKVHLSHIDSTTHPNPLRNSANVARDPDAGRWLVCVPGPVVCQRPIPRAAKISPSCLRGPARLIQCLFGDTVSSTERHKPMTTANVRRTGVNRTPLLQSSTQTEPVGSLVIG